MISLHQQLLQSADGRNYDRLYKSSSGAILAVEPQQVKLPDRQLIAFSDLALTPKLRAMLIFKSDGKSTCALGGTKRRPVCRKLLRGLAGAKVLITYYGAHPDFLVKQFVPFRALFQGDNWDKQFFGTSNHLASGTVTLPVAWDPQHYPSDASFVDAAASVTLPRGVTTRRGTKSSAESQADFTISLMGKLNGNSELGAKEASLGTAGTLGDFQLTVRRDGTTQRYTYAIALVPVVLLLVLVLVLFLGDRGQRRKKPTQDTLVSLGAVILTILPLRAVLVPPEVEGLTRVDHLLGLELVVLLFASVVKFAWQSW